MTFRTFMLGLSLFGMPAAALVVPSVALAAAPSVGDMTKMLQVVDDRQHNTGDYHSVVYIERKETDKSDLVYLASVYRRDSTNSLVILFLKPQSEAGKGYLRVDKNLFMYDPTVGKWERRTEREKIGGTDSQRADFDQSTLAIDFVPAFVGEEPLGKYTVEHLHLTATPTADVAYPLVDLWLDKDTGNVLKRQDFAESNKLMRTTYYPSWEKQYSASKKSDVYYAKEIRIFDEVEKGNQTTIAIQSVDMSPLDDSMFTKAWLESKSR